jgi:uncharacterized protein (DUF1810 family)
MSLERFVLAQEVSYAGALAELKAGRKTGHWIWWIFPQLKGLGRSHNLNYFGLADKDEACAYLAHPVLGLRYRESVATIHEHLCLSGISPQVLMGDETDVLKLRSSIRIFIDVAPSGETPFLVQAEEVFNALG